MTYSISDLQFPIYRVGTEKPQQENGVLFYERTFTDKDPQILILDDLNQPGNSLAIRRLSLKVKGAKLKSLDMAIFFLGDFIKLATSKMWFIDSQGFLFTHTKRLRVKLKFYPISKVIPIPTGGAVIEVEGISTRFKTLYAPNYEKYAGILRLGQIHILYGLYNVKPKDTWRAV